MRIDADMLGEIVGAVVADHVERESVPLLERMARIEGDLAARVPVEADDTIERFVNTLATRLLA
jgi:hypothetical protein